MKILSQAIIIVLLMQQVCLAEVIIPEAKSLSAIVQLNAFIAEKNLNSEEVLNELSRLKWWRQVGKWSTLALTGTATAVGTIAADSSDRNKSLAITTLVLGTIATIAVAIRDDGEIIEKIGACKETVTEGNSAIGRYRSEWGTAALTFDAKTPLQKETDLANHSKAATELFSTISASMGKCRIH